MLNLDFEMNGNYTASRGPHDASLGFFFPLLRFLLPINHARTPYLFFLKRFSLSLLNSPCIYSSRRSFGIVCLSFSSLSLTPHGAYRTTAGMWLTVYLRISSRSTREALESASNVLICSCSLIVNLFSAN